MSWTAKTDIMVYRRVDGRIETYTSMLGFNENHNQQEFNNLLRSGKYAMLAVKKTQPCENDVTKFRNMADNIKLVTNSVIDITKFGQNYPEIAKYVFNITNKEKIEVEPIDPQEVEWLRIVGALTFTKRPEIYKGQDELIVYEGEATQYDVNWQYPSEMAKKANTFPVGKGNLTILKDGEKKKDNAFYQYGIYRAIVHKSGNTDTDVQFRFTPLNK